MASICEMVAYRQDGGVVARSPDGAVAFRPVATGDGRWDFEITATEGRNPLGDQDPTRFGTLEEERAHLYPSREANAYPHAYETLAQVFEHADAPDIAAVHTAAHNWEDRGGHRGEHGSLDVVQARAPLILSGKGVQHLGRVPRASRLINVAPTMLQWLGLPTRTGTRLDGSTGATWLARQDGHPESDVLTGEAPRHLVAFLLDGTNPNVLHSMIDAGRLPHLGRLASTGVDFQFGAMASFPTVTLANHTATLTGCHPGHHGILHNAFYRRSTAEQILTNHAPTWPWSRRWLHDHVETVHEAIHAVEPDAFTASCNEPTDRGADYSTFEAIRGGGRPPFEVPPLPPHGTERFVRPYKDYRWGSRTDHTAVVQAAGIWSGHLAGVSYGKPRFMWVNFTLTDSASHRGGPHSEMAETALEETDARIGDILAAIEAEGCLDDCGFVVVADHGMEETDPGVTGDWSDALRQAGVDHRDEAYGFIYLTSPS